MGVGDTVVFLCARLVSVFDDLPNADLPLSSTWPVEGTLAVEICCGEGIFTFGLMMQRVPCMKPWDAQFGDQFDVLANGWILVELVRLKRIVIAHLAPPCQSATWGRSPALRTWDFPEGLPGLSPKSAKLVALGNAVAKFCAALCFELYIAGGYFTLENPRLSWLWALRCFLALYSLDGVIYTLVLYSDYGAAYSKPTIIIHNTPTMHSLRLGVPGAATVVLRGLVKWHGEWVARTHLASMYPPRLGKAFGGCAAEALQLREVALNNGSQVPLALEAEDFGFPLPACGYCADVVQGAVRAAAHQPSKMIRGIHMYEK